MNGRPVRWRARWALAQITGVLFSSVVWIVLLAISAEVALAALAGGVAAFALNRRPVMWRLVFGARPATAAEQDAVLRAIVPLGSLRGRNQPRVWVIRRRQAHDRYILAPRRRTLLVCEPLLAEIKAGRISDPEVSAPVAHALGKLPALGSPLVVAVDLYCLPWAIGQVIAGRITCRLARMPLMSLSWRMRPIVFGAGLLDAVQHSRWEAAIPLVVLTVLTYTTGPLNRAWQRKLTEMGDRRVADEGLGSVSTRLVLDSHDPVDCRHAQTLWAVPR